MIRYDVWDFVRRPDVGALASHTTTTTFLPSNRDSRGSAAPRDVPSASSESVNDPREGTEAEAEPDPDPDPEEDPPACASGWWGAGGRVLDRGAGVGDGVDEGREGRRSSMRDAMRREGSGDRRGWRRGEGGGGGNVGRSLSCDSV